MDSFLSKIKKKSKVRITLGPVWGTKELAVKLQ
jgi:hypothetical protein